MNEGSQLEPPKRPGVGRGSPPAEVVVRICPWCGGEPLAGTDYCEECDLTRHDWLNVRYRLGETDPRGSHLDYWGARPICGCITAWMTWASTEEEVGEFARNMKASGRDVIRGTRAEYIDRLDRCPHTGETGG